MKIEKITPNNIEPLTKLIITLWPETSYQDEIENCKRILNSATEICFLAKKQNSYIAFIYLSLRTEHVEGTSTSPVAYIEGIFVKPSFRKTGIAKTLVAVGENWAHKQGCKQIASDAELNNPVSIEFHKKVGFNEVNRVVCFIKKLD